MRGRDRVAAERVRRPLEKGVAQFPRRLFDPKAPLPRIALHVPVPDQAGDVPGAAVILDEGRVAQALLPAQAVLVMGGADGEILPLPQSVQQRHGIGPAGDRAEHAAPGP